MRSSSRLSDDVATRARAGLATMREDEHVRLAGRLMASKVLCVVGHHFADLLDETFGESLPRLLSAAAGAKHASAEAAAAAQRAQHATAGLLAQLRKLPPGLVRRVTERLPPDSGDALTTLLGPRSARNPPPGSTSGVQ